jgi:hypothetical protein
MGKTNGKMASTGSQFRRPHIIFFRRLLMLRGFHAHSSTSQLKCRERTVDAEMTCVDCVRLCLWRTTSRG